MKGLLMKDLMLMKNQKQSFMIMFLVGIMFMIMNEEPSAAISYVTVMFSIFSITTISYDEFDNGMSFLFTLPVNRIKYVIEKYIFGILICLSGLAGICVLTGVAAIVRNLDISFGEYLPVAAGGFMIATVMMAVMIPLQLKFGSEKSRAALLGTMGIAVFIGYVIVKTAVKAGVDFDKIIEIMEGAGSGTVIFTLLIVSCIAIGISCFVSIIIMRKKEF